MAELGQGYRRADRLRRRSDFLRVQSNGRRVHTSHFVVALAPTDVARGRLGVTVTKKVANAVGRNRVKRLVREFFRRNRSRLPTQCDLVFIAKRGADTLGYLDLENEVLRVERRIMSTCRQALSSVGEQS